MVINWDGTEDQEMGVTQRLQEGKEEQFTITLPSIGKLLETSSKIHELEKFSLESAICNFKHR